METWRATAGGFVGTVLGWLMFFACIVRISLALFNLTHTSAAPGWSAEAAGGGQQDILTRSLALYGYPAKNSSLPVLAFGFSTVVICFALRGYMIRLRRALRKNAARRAAAAGNPCLLLAAYATALYFCAYPLVARMSLPVKYRAVLLTTLAAEVDQRLFQEIVDVCFSLSAVSALATYIALACWLRRPATPFDRY